jgi:hypothetical protein
LELVTALTLHGLDTETPGLRYNARKDELSKRLFDFLHGARETPVAAVEEDEDEDEDQEEESVSDNEVGAGLGIVVSDIALTDTSQRGTQQWSRWWVLQQRQTTSWCGSATVSKLRSTKTASLRTCWHGMTNTCSDAIAPLALGVRTTLTIWMTMMMTTWMMIMRVAAITLKKTTKHAVREAFLFTDWSISTQAQNERAAITDM